MSFGFDKRSHLHDLVGEVPLRQLDGHVKDAPIGHLRLGLQHLYTHKANDEQVSNHLLPWLAQDVHADWQHNLRTNLYKTDVHDD